MAEATATTLVGDHTDVVSRETDTECVFDKIERLNNELKTLPMGSEYAKSVQASLDQLNTMADDYRALVDEQSRLIGNVEKHVEKARKPRKVYRHQSFVGDVNY